VHVDAHATARALGSVCGVSAWSYVKAHIEEPRGSGEEGEGGEVALRGKSLKTHSR